MSRKYGRFRLKPIDADSACRSRKAVPTIASRPGAPTFHTRSGASPSWMTVSYTHLDVYKRQSQRIVMVQCCSPVTILHLSSLALGVVSNIANSFCGYAIYGMILTLKHYSLVVGWSLRCWIATAEMPVFQIHHAVESIVLGALCKYFFAR